MDFRELESFVAVAEELHFHRAAARVHLTQPALTRHVRRLETELGVELLRRSSRSVELTEAGAAFLEEVRIVLGRTERACRVARQVGRGEVGRLAIGHVDGACYVVLPAVVRRMRDEFGELSVLLTEMESIQLLAAVRSGELDVAFTRSEGGEAVESTKILDERVVVALPAGHHLTDQDRVPLAALADELFVIFGRHTSPVAFGLVNEACRRAGFTPRIREEVDGTLSRLALVAGGVGISLEADPLPRYTCLPGVEWRPLAGESVRLPLYAHWRSDDRRETTARLVELFAEEASAQFPAEPPTAPARGRRRL